MPLNNETIAARLLHLSEVAENAYQIENAIWAAVEAAKTMGYIAEEK